MKPAPQPTPYASRPERLTDRELEVLGHVAAGLHNHEIAVELRLSIKTVEFHLCNILGKLGSRSRTEAVVRGWQAGMLKL
jgi:LuxR family maltose regulon positive regulatory protein